MQDTLLYEYLLGLKSPWSVSRVNLDVKERRVDVWAGHPENAVWACPQCSKKLPLYDHAEERTWRHLDSCQFQTHLHARIPRVDCPEHGVVQVGVPWAEPRSRFTLLFERLAIDVLSQCDVTGATRILGISWDEAWGLMQRAVKRGQGRKQAKVVRRIGVDEKAAAKGHRYLTLVCDLDGGTVEHIAEDRKQDSLDCYYAGLSEAQLNGIEAVAMDMWQPYIQATLAKVPGAAGKIVFDRFHVMGYIGKAVDTVRRQEHQELMASGDETLKGSKHLWLYSWENVPEWKCDLEMKPVAVIFNDKELVRLLIHFNLPAEFPTFKPAPPQYAAKRGPPNEDCQLNPLVDQYDAIDPPSPED